MSEHGNEIAKKQFSVSYIMNKKITLKQGDIFQAKENADLLICSAFCGKYKMKEGTLIGCLGNEGIVVSELAMDADFRFDVYDEEHVRRCWVSKELEDKMFRRIACVELKNIEGIYTNNDTLEEKKMSEIDLLKNVFGMFRKMLEKLAMERVELRKIVMTVPGIGNQQMELHYVLPVLLAQCESALKNIRELEEIVIYERNIDKANEIKNMMVDVKESTTKQVFISYSSKDSEWASKICESIRKKGVACWKAPEDIPAGSNYQQEIPKGLRETYIMVVILTENSEKSRWCYKEIGSAIGNGHIVLPVKIKNYQSSEQFQFLMDGEQIFPGYEYLEKGDEEQMLDKITKVVMRFVQNHNIYANNN